MMCVFPVFITDEAQWRLFIDHQAILAGLASSLADSPGVEAVHVVYGEHHDDVAPINHPKVFQHVLPNAARSSAHKEGMALSRQGSPDGQNENGSRQGGTIPLPPGTAPTLRWLSDIGRVPPETLLCVADFRNPFLTAQHFEDAQGAHGGVSGAMLSSAFKAIDHPCQANIPYSIEFFGLVHLLDTQASLPPEAVDHLGPDVVATRPFSFDWCRRNIPEQPGAALHLQRATSEGVRYEPVRTPEQWTEARRNRVLLRIDHDTACWVYPLESWRRICPLPGAIGATLHEGIGTETSDSIASISRNAAGTGLTLSLDLTHSAGRNLRVRVVPLTLSGPVLADFLEANLPSGVRQLDLPLPQEPVSGFLVVILAETGLDSIDMLLPYIPEQQLWTYDYRSQQRLHCSTGQPITGRQAFPDVFQPDGSFTIAHAGDLLTTPVGLQHRLYPIPQESAITSTYQLCLLRHNIRSGGERRV